MTILGLGHHVPDNIVPNQEILDRVGVSDEWIVRRTGIRRRRHAAGHMRLTDLAVPAARGALADAGMTACDIDLVLVATMTPDEVAPNAAPLVAHVLGASRAGAIDVGAACAGWLSALHIATGLIEAGRAERVLVIGAEIMSRVLDHEDPRTAPLFGDGAAAAVVGRGDAGGVGPIALHADGGLADAIVVRHSDRRLRLNGHETFAAAVRHLSESTVAAVKRSGMQLGDIDLFVYHQANSRIIRAVGARLAVDPAKLADYIGDFGNTSAASIPLTLSLLRNDGRLHPGQRLLVAAIGAGFTWGAGVLEWGLG